MSDPIGIAEQFNFPAAIDKVEPYGSGIINDTFVVTFVDPPYSEHPRMGKRAILQCINGAVFPEPNLVMHNLAVVLEHANNKIPKDHPEFILPSIYKTSEGEFSVKDEAGNYWRAISFIENTMTSNVLESPTQAREAGVALGAFHQLLADFPMHSLHDTLPGFHNTPVYLSVFDALVAKGQPIVESKTKVNLGKSCFSSINDINVSQDYCFNQIEKHRDLAGLLYDLQPEIKLRVMHGDPKLNNFLFDQKSGQAVSIIDLDTVRPGIIHYDLGDCVRSCCNMGGEMPESIADAQFSVENFEAILNGYLSRAGRLFDKRDFDLLYDVVKLLPFELGIRFFTDYLNGNRYFKVESPDDNLYRARIQLQLLSSIESQEQKIQQAITQCRQSLDF